MNLVKALPRGGSHFGDESFAVVDDAKEENAMGDPTRIVESAVEERGESRGLAASGTASETAGEA